MTDAKKVSRVRLAGEAAARALNDRREAHPMSLARKLLFAEVDPAGTLAGLGEAETLAVLLLARYGLANLAARGEVRGDVL